MVDIFKVIKLLSFALCLSAFVWKVCDSVIEYVRGEVGTKIAIRSNAALAMPSFAVCRHPNQILNFWNDDWKTLQETMGIYPQDLNTLDCFRILEDRNSSLREVLEEFLYMKTSPMISLEIEMDGLWTRLGLTIDPQNNEDHWHHFLHPTLGFCHSVNFNAQVQGVIGETLLNDVKMKLNFTDAYPVEPYEPYEPFTSDPNKPVISDPTTLVPEETETSSAFKTTLAPPPPFEDGEIKSNTTLLPLLEREEQVFASPELTMISGQMDHYVPMSDVYGYHDQQLLVIVFQEGSFLTTQEVGSIQSGTDQYNTLDIEVVDHSSVSEIFHCDATPDYIEDNCLYQCLIEKFSDTFGCLHPRLSHLIDQKEWESHSFCGYRDILEIYTGAGGEIDNATEDIGRNFIESTLKGFHVGQDQSARCSCPKPCRLTYFKLQKWDSPYTEHYGLPEYHYQFQSIFKIYEYHLLYSANDLIADIGGYLGLFLGLSVYGLVEMLEKTWTIKDAKAEGEEQIQPETELLNKIP